ncbi:hypothetical protein ACFLRM_00230, partial [Acidobacteriota bacterium]
KCLCFKIDERYNRASEIIKEITDFKDKDTNKEEIDDIWGRIKAREREERHLCWNCRKPLPHKTKNCLHCGEPI